MTGKKIPLTAEQLAMANLYRIEAIIRVLERNGCLTNQQVMDELEVMKREDEDIARGN